MAEAFSPTSSEIASFCMRKWGFYKAGYRLRIMTYRDACAIVGIAFAAGAAHINRMVMAGESPATGLDIAVNIAKEEARLELEHWIQAGATISPKDENTFDKLTSLVELAVTLFVQKYPHEGTILQVEQSYPDYGNARLDLLYQRKADNKLVVCDYKVKVKQQAQWWNKEVSRYEKAHQMYEYVDMTKADAYEICFIILSPRPDVKVIPYRVDPDFFRLWKLDADAIWQRMSIFKGANLGDMPGNLTHEDKWGVCDYAEACLRGRLDLMNLDIDFIKIERRRDAAH